MTDRIEGLAQRARRRPRICLVPFGAVFILLLMLLHPARGWAAAYGSLNGVVRDDSDRPLPGAKVVLESETHATLEEQTDSTGRFNFPKVAIGHYLLTISRREFASVSEPVTVEAGYFPFANIVLMQPSKLSEVTVTASRLPPVGSMTPITIVSQEDIENTPGASNANSSAMITDYVPGAYQAHDMLHMRGGHQTNWLIDGVEIPNTNIAENLAPEIDPQDIQTLGAERGSYAADEGDRTYGIFNVIPKSGFSSINQADLDVTAGNFGQTDDYVSVASHTSDFAYYTSVEGNRSNLGLQTPQSQVIHDNTQGYGVFTNRFPTVPCRSPTTRTASDSSGTCKVRRTILRSCPGRTPCRMTPCSRARFSIISNGRTMTGALATIRPSLPITTARNTRAPKRICG